MTSTPVGTYTVHPQHDSIVRMQTSRIGFTSFEIEAPVTAGELTVGEQESSLRVELALDRLRTNALMQGAARALVASGNGDTLVFTADGPGAADELLFVGDAQAGDVIVPMTMTAVVARADGSLLVLSLSGSAEFRDVHIPLPGMGGIRVITADLSATLAVTAV